MDRVTEVGIVGMVVCIFVLFWVTAPFAEYTYVGEVVVYTIIEGPYIHTDLELKTYSGSSVTVQFEGALDLNVGDIIKISTKWSPSHFFASITYYEVIS